MRKYLFLLMAALVLVACGSDTTGTNEEVNNNESNEANDIEVEYTSDPIEAVTGDHEMFVDEFDYSYSIVDWYTNDDTTDGFNTMDFEGYEVKYAIALLMDEDGNDVIGIFSETENNTDHVAQYNMDFEILTNESEQLEGDPMYGIGETNPGIKTKGFVKDTLEYDVPTELDITFYPPWDSESEFDDEIGDPIEVGFTKE